MLKSKKISSVKVSETFVDFSFKYNYDPSHYTSQLARLISIWENQEFIEIYQTASTKAYGKIKSSEIDGKGSFIYQYCDLYHARLFQSHYDPLVVLKFQQDPDNLNQEYVSLRFISDHDQLFGTLSVKNDRNHLKIRDKADVLIQKGDRHE